MGLSLSVLVALCIFLPGATFVFGLTRLHSPTSPTTPLDQHLSVGLAIAVGAAVLFQGVWLAIWVSITDGLDFPVPDATQVIALLAGDTKTAKGLAGMASVENYPLRISLYFVSLSLLTWYIGKKANGLIKRKPAANWYDMLKPKDATFVWLTADMHMDGHCYLYAGPVGDFSIGKDGSLERVVLEYAVRRPLNEASDEDGVVLAGGWVEIPGEFVVLIMSDVKTINIDYFFEEDTSSPDDSELVQQEAGLPHWCEPNSPA